MGNDQQLEDTTRMWFGKKQPTSQMTTGALLFIYFMQVHLRKSAESEFVKS
jgi:hypothetical protein